MNRVATIVAGGQVTSVTASGALKGLTMQIDGQRYYGEHLLSEVLSARALALCVGQDGRSHDPALIGGIRELAHVADDLDLPCAGAFETLANVVSKGHTRDIEAAALRVLCE